MAVANFRELILERVPWWLRGFLGSRILYAIGVQADALGDAVGEGVRRRFPGLDSDDSLDAIGRDRRVARGRTEPAANYKPSLLRWLDDHRIRGGPYALLRRLHDFYTGRTWPIHLIYRGGRRFVMQPDGTTVRDIYAWDPDLTPELWAKWWLFHIIDDPTIYTSDGDWSALGYWDEGEIWDSVPGATWDGIETWTDFGITWDDGGTWDTSLTIAEVENLRVVPKDRENAHTFGSVVLLNDETELWNYPPGTWDDPGNWPGYSALILSV
jgi:hypothetical protein